MMNFDVLRPELIWVEGRCYRKLPVRLSDTKYMYEEENSDEDEIKGLEFDRIEGSSCPVDKFAEDESSIDFEPSDPKNPNSGWLQIKMDVAKDYLRFIIGRQGETKRRLESQTQTEIQVPRINEFAPLAIRGRNKKCILDCRRKILALIDAARQRQDPTHFLSIPFNCDQIKENFGRFKSQVLETCDNCRGVDESIFNKPEKLHLTIAMMVLMSESERNAAKQALAACQRDIIKPALSQLKSKRFWLRGLDYMNDDPSEVNVLFGKILTEDGGDAIHLQRLIDQVVAYFNEHNILVRQNMGDFGVKMHVTLMNTKFSSQNQSSQNTSVQSSGYGNDSNNRFRRSPPFDARKILELYKDFDFGFQQIHSLHISQRHAFAADGYYESTDRILFE